MTEAVLLAGGKSRRMGKDKLSLMQGNMTVLESACLRFDKVFDKVYISVDTPLRYPDLDYEHICDIYPDCGPLGGLHAALSVCRSGGVFLAASDLPFSNPELAREMMRLAEGADICITVDSEGRFEPLFGYYSKAVLETAEALLKKGIYKMTALYENHRVKQISPDLLGGLWSEKAFENMNYPADYGRLLSK